MPTKRSHSSAVRAKKRRAPAHSASNRVNVRELRQNLSKYLLRVKAGESLEVAERGEPVAVLRPFRRSANALDRMVADGLVIPATSRLDDLSPPLPAQPGPTLSEILAQMRAEERW